MKIPSAQSEKQGFVQYVIECCMGSMEDRRSLYERRRRYFLYGQDQDIKVKYNQLKSHMKLVSSFLFSPDGLIYNIAPPKNADEATIQQFLALQDDWNEDVHDSGLADVVSDAILWALNFDTMIIKQGWNDITGQGFGKLLEPGCFGVWREDDTDFSSQVAMNHRFSLDYDEACQRLIRAGKGDLIPTLQLTDAPVENALPSVMTNIIVASIQGTGVQENISGFANPDYEATPLFRARTTVPMITFDETWIWDSEILDYRIFHSLGGGTILLSDSLETIDTIKKVAKEKGAIDRLKFSSESNFFLEKENPFTPLTPFPLYNYFWGDAHIEDIIPLQDWSEERLTWIEEILQAQVDPLRTGHGMTGLIDEKMDLDYGAFVADDNPSSKMEEHRPPMPEDAFREFDKISSLMLQASGLSEVVAGKGSGGARGGQQQKQMQITGGGEIRKTAIRLEAPLVRIGEVGLKLKMKNDDSKIKLPNGETFIAAQAEGEFSMRVDGHSHSPLFTMENSEKAATLFKARAIDREWFIRMLNPTQKQNLLHALKKMEAAEAKQQEVSAIQNAKKGKK